MSYNELHSRLDQRSDMHALVYALCNTQNTVCGQLTALSAYHMMHSLKKYATRTDNANATRATSCTSAIV